MYRMPTRTQDRRTFTWLGLCGIMLVLLTGCTASAPGSQVSTATPGVTASSTTITTPTITNPPVTPTTSATNPPADWSSLESKPLHLPTVAAGTRCPVTQPQQHIAPDHQYAAGNGPVYLVNEALNNPVIFLDPDSSDPGSSWKISKVFWEISAVYTGPALVRGRRIDGTGILKFNGGLGQTAGNNQGTEPLLSELRLQGDPHGQWKTYLTFLRIQQAGCYAFQVDGQNFSENIVIQ